MLRVGSTVVNCRIRKAIRAIGIGFIVAVVTGGCASQAVVDDRKAQLLPLAEKGDAEAQFQLGKETCCGYGPGRSTATGLQWLCKAALQQHAGAQYHLGRYYGWRADSYHRPAIRQELITAYMWYSLAALQSYPLAAGERDALALDMSAGELGAANERARTWPELGCQQ